MIFQDSPVIVENGQTTARIDVKVVGCARMVEIVDNGCHQGREDFQVRHPILKPQKPKKSLKMVHVIIHDFWRECSKIMIFDR